jgi:hypothetical protein
MHSARYTLTAAVLYLVGTLAMTSSSVLDESRCELRHNITHSCWWEEHILKSSRQSYVGKKAQESTHDFSATSLPDHLSFTVTVSKRRQCEHSNVRLS